MKAWHIAILSLLATGVLYAGENPLDLQHIRLSAGFRQQLEAKNIRTAAPRQELEFLLPAIFDKDFVAARRKKSSLGDGQESLLFGELRDWLESRYQGIGAEESQRLQAANAQFDFGQMNIGGLSWQRPFGGFSLFVERQLSPDLFDANRWIVMDTFTVLVEATSFLSRLTEAGAVDMSASEIAAFAGISFKRVYTSYHFAPTFLAGLVADYRWLFLPFTRFHTGGLLELKEGQVVRKEDTWSLAVGGLVEAPPWNGLSFSAGVLLEANHSSSVTAQHVPPGEASRVGEFLRVAQSAKTLQRGGVAAQLQLDFLKLLKFTLLSSDLVFEQEAQSEVQLSFGDAERSLLSQDSPLRDALAGLLRTSSKLEAPLLPYTTRLDQSSESSTATRGMLFLWGRLKKTGIEQVHLIKGDLRRHFIKVSSESVRLVQNFWSRLFSSAIFRIFKFSTVIQNDASLTRRLLLEYEARHPSAIDPRQLIAMRSADASVVLSLSYQALSTVGKSARPYRQEAAEFVKRFTTLPADWAKKISSTELRGPLRITANLRLLPDALDAFHALPEELAHQSFRRLCSGAKACVQKLQAPYARYQKTRIATGQLELVALRELLEVALAESPDLQSLAALFGGQLFAHGTLSATTPQGQQLNIPFSRGLFKGLGIIDNAARNDGVRLPASIWSE